MNNTEITQSEHLAWCKARAFAYCDAGNCNEAAASFMSDMKKHPRTANHVALPLMFTMMLSGHLNTPDEMRKFIAGFN